MPPEFERMGGRSAAKKWKQSIKVMNRNGTVGMCLGDWLVENGYETRAGAPDDRHVELVVTARPPQMMLLDGGGGNPFGGNPMSFNPGGPPPFFGGPASAPAPSVYPGSVMGPPPSASAPSQGQPILIGPGQHSGPGDQSMFGPPQPMQPPLNLPGNFYQAGPVITLAPGSQGPPPSSATMVTGPMQQGQGYFMDPSAQRNSFAHTQQLMGPGGGMMQVPAAAQQVLMQAPGQRSNSGGNASNPMQQQQGGGPDGQGNPSPSGQQPYLIVTEPPTLAFVDGRVMLKATAPTGLQIFMPLPNSPMPNNFPMGPPGGGSAPFPAPSGGME